MCMIGKAQRVRTVPAARPLVAYRAVRVNGAVWSTVNDYRWNRGPNHSGSRPALRGERGFWAFSTRARARTYVMDGASWRVVTVRLWGRVVEHERGYRAEWAQIVRWPRMRKAAQS